MTDITYNLSFQVKDGPRIPITDSFQVEAIDKIDVQVSANTSLKVHIQPGELQDIEFLLLTHVNQPSDPTKKLTYQVNDDATEIELKNLHLVLGKGSFGLLKNAPNWLTFKNDDDSVAVVMVLVGRKATPPTVAPVTGAAVPEPKVEPIPAVLAVPAPQPMVVGQAAVVQVTAGDGSKDAKPTAALQPSAE